MEPKDPRYPNKYIVIGAVCLFLGGLLLLWTNKLLPGFTTLWPVPVIIVGMTFLYLAFLRYKHEILILPGMFLSLAGILFLLLNTVLTKSSFLKIWPAFMMCTGISLIPYAYKKRSSHRIGIIIPAIAIIALSLLFLPFSLGISPISFTDFISNWWPMLLVLLGFFLISFYFYRKARQKNRQR